MALSLQASHLGDQTAKCHLLGRTLIPLKGEYMRKRNKEIKVRFTEKELEELDAKVAKTYLSRENYIRAVLAGYEIMEAPDVDARELIKQVLKVGNNLNYLMFLAQCQNFIDVPELRKVTNAIWECHRAIMKAYTPPSVRKKIWKEED